MVTNNSLTPTTHATPEHVESICEEQTPKSKTGRYRDYSQLAPRGMVDGKVNPFNFKDNNLTSTVRQSRSINFVNFPKKLHEILSDPMYESIIAWLPHGRGWRVTNPSVFEKHIVPKFFTHTRYRSFLRQLSIWGFRRITHNCYFNEFFLRGLPHLCPYMHRLTKEDHAQRKKEGDNLIEFNVFACANPLSLKPIPVLSKEGQGTSPVGSAKILIREESNTAKKIGTPSRIVTPKSKDTYSRTIKRTSKKNADNFFSAAAAAAGTTKTKASLTPTEYPLTSMIDVASVCDDFDYVPIITTATPTRASLSKNMNLLQEIVKTETHIVPVSTNPTSLRDKLNMFISSQSNWESNTFSHDEETALCKDLFSDDTNSISEVLTTIEEPSEHKGVSIVSCDFTALSKDFDLQIENDDQSIESLFINSLETKANGNNLVCATSPSVASLLSDCDNISLADFDNNYSISMDNRNCVEHSDQLLLSTDHLF